MGKNNKSLVYSSEGGRLCSGCNRPVDECSCRTAQKSSGQGPVRVRLETKGRRGKAVTVVTGIPLDSLDLADLGLEDMRVVHPGILVEVYEVLGVDNSVASRQSYGGTAPVQVRAQISRWREALGS